MRSIAAPAFLAAKYNSSSRIRRTTIAAGVAKTHQLIERDQVDFIVGNVNSAVALAMTRVTAEKRKLHIVTGGHTDEITGNQCSWNVFRICNTTTMEANAIADTLIERFGKKWYFLTPDYVYGTRCKQLRAQASRAWRHMAEDVLPLGTVDYSRALLNAGAYRPHVLIDLMGGEDQTNSLRQVRASGSTRTWLSAGHCSNWKASWPFPTRHGLAGGRWNGGGINLTFPRSGL